jgi:hypothetical protein
MIKPRVLAARTQALHETPRVQVGVTLDLSRVRCSGPICTGVRRGPRSVCVFQVVIMVTGSGAKNVAQSSDGANVACVRMRKRASLKSGGASKRSKKKTSCLILLLHQKDVPSNTRTLRVHYTPFMTMMTPWGINLHVLAPIGHLANFNMFNDK